MASRVDTATVTDLVLPFNNSWELWRLRDDREGGSKAEYISTVEDPSKFKANTKPVFCIPLQYVNCLPLWILTKDEKLMPDMVDLQMENRGILSFRDKAPVYDYKVIRQTDTKTLVMGVSLDDSFPAEWEATSINRYDVSVSHYRFPEDQWTIWKEWGKYVAVLNVGGSIVFFQALSIQEIDENFISELRCINLQLFSEGVSLQNPPITFWTDLTPDEKQFIEEALKTTIIHAERPQPHFSKDFFKLTPSNVSIQKAVGKRRQQIRNMGIGLVAMYAMALALLGGYLFMKNTEINKMKTQVDQTMPIVDSIEDASMQWSYMALALEPDLNPLYALLSATQVMPKEGVRMTFFQQKDFTLIIQGEARNAPTATAYVTQLKKADSFSGYEWSDKPPSELPNRTWRFNITAKHPYAPTEEE
ncbi:MAG: hypothetical protein AAF984_03970 [Verrucomicrobiota bacterium]